MIKNAQYNILLIGRFCLAWNRFSLGKKENINYFQNGQSVKNKKENKPEFLAVSGRAPKRRAFPRNGPNDNSDKKINSRII
jgi:hypothetical protein